MLTQNFVVDLELESSWLNFLIGILSQSQVDWKIVLTNLSQSRVNTIFVASLESRVESGSLWNESELSQRQNLESSTTLPTACHHDHTRRHFLAILSTNVNKLAPLKATLLESSLVNSVYMKWLVDWLRLANWARLTRKLMTDTEEPIRRGSWTCSVHMPSARTGRTNHSFNNRGAACQQYIDSIGIACWKWLPISCNGKHETVSSVQNKYIVL